MVETALRRPAAWAYTAQFGSPVRFSHHIALRLYPSVSKGVPSQAGAGGGRGERTGPPVSTIWSRRKSLCSAMPGTCPCDDGERRSTAAKGLRIGLGLYNRAERDGDLIEFLTFSFGFRCCSCVIVVETVGLWFLSTSSRPDPTRSRNDSPRQFHCGKLSLKIHGRYACRHGHCISSATGR